MMSTEMAARYLSVDEEILHRLVARFQTSVVQIDDLPVRWRKPDLDRLIRKLPLIDASSIGGRQPRLFKLEPPQIEAIAEAIAKRTQRTSPGPQGKLVSINEAAEMLGIGRSSIYRMITEGNLETRKIGRRRLILRADIQAILEGAGKGPDRQG